MVDRIFAVNRKAVLSFFNFFKNDHQFIANYCNTIAKLGAKDQYSIKCFRTIYFLLISQAIFQVYLYLCPLQWQQSMVFNIFDQSNNYPNTLKLSTSTIFLMSAYLFYMLHFPIRSERCFELAREWYLNENQTFTKIPALKIKKIIVAILDGYQVFVIIALIFLGGEYIVFTFRILHGGGASLPVWTRWAELVSMNIFFVAFASAFCLFIYISYTCVTCGIICIALALFRFRQTHRPLWLPYSRFTTLRLLRFGHQNIDTMQYIFSLNQLYGAMLLGFLLANLPSNVMTATYLLQNQFSSRQTIFMLGLFSGQLSCIIGVHLMTTVFSENIHRPYKRIQALNILIRRCPLRARINVANLVQTFHVESKYGITYGTGKWTFGLVTMMSFAKFTLLYGELLMYQYHHMER